MSKLPVRAWRDAVSFPTYEPMPADKNPMFLEKRVYQGSSGKVYPLPFFDRIAEQKTERKWDAVHLENEFVRVMILPEIGGRIHVGQDKTNGYDFFYRQNVIKPALVGLAGPWISGGVEFNWPQHHRPATFMPVNIEIENHADGSVTVWCSDHDPMARMKGMHGVCLHPDKAFIELKVRAYNRTPFVQTFLWWANVATRVHEAYQSFFPPDVYYVADHARRSMSEYPLCRGHYYGVDYGARGKNGVPENEVPANFVPPHCARQIQNRLRAERPFFLRKHSRAHFLHVHGVAGGFLRRLRSRGAGWRCPCREPSHLARKKTVDVGQPRIRLRVGSQPHRRRRALHRNHGGRLHRQPAGLFVPDARRNKVVEPVLVSDSKDRPRPAREPRRRREPARRAGQSAHRRVGFISFSSGKNHAGGERKSHCDIHARPRAGRFVCRTDSAVEKHRGNRPAPARA